MTNSDLKDAQALITRTRTRCNEELLAGTEIKFIATATIGYDHIDTDYCNKNGITWTNAPGCNSGSVYQYIASVLCTLAEKYSLNFPDISLGVIGVGNVGRKIVRLGELMGAQVYLNDPPRQRELGTCGFISLEGIIRESNIITLHVPLTMEGPDKTYHMVDEAFLKKLSPETILINSSRGEVVDNNALKKALKEKWIRGAVLDVWENEPEIDLELLELVDIATPHIAGYSTDGKANGTAMSVQALSKKFGLPLTRWQPEDLPLPDSFEKAFDCTDKVIWDIMAEVILSTYNVMEDDYRLRNSVSTFEKQRGEYPLRREFDAFKVQLLNECVKTGQKLRHLGFKIKE
ncbi:MAG: 4-phosphoerythronate dehydrogenase [Bacteroidales bacterium]|nr:4-phosphoerythronate dehydrogenase [Bacteroidales bacterium]